MKHQTYLNRRGAVYYCRIRIPRDIQAHFGGRREFNISLRTRDRRRAVADCRRMVQRITAQFEKLRGQDLSGGEL